MLLIICIIALTYTILILSLVFSFDKVLYFKEAAEGLKTRFSIIIPFRNEAEHLEDLLISLNDLDYPKNSFEILLIDDNSNDESLQVIANFKTQHPDLDITATPSKTFSKSPKKDAITTAIRYSTYDWLITTDADCVASKDWLKTIDSFIKKHNPKMIVAPLSYTIEPEFLDGFQALEVLSLQAATIGGFGLKQPFICNGANFIYEKSLFHDLNGFEGNTKIASGDDVFLMEKALAHFPNDVMYLKSKSALVFSKPELSFKALMQQRMRWAAKTSHYSNTFGKGVALIVFIMNLTMIICYILAITGLFQWTYLLFLFLLKVLVDVSLIYKSAVLFKQTAYLKHYPLSTILYPFFSVIIVILTFFTGYRWKGRRFKK